MASHEPIQRNHLINQENPTSRIPAKSDTINNKFQPLRRAALDDLANKIHNLQNANETTNKNTMGPPTAVNKKKIEIKKKPVLSSFSKENISIENQNNVKKPLAKKPIRQESILFLKPSAIAEKPVEAVKKPVEAVKKPVEAVKKPLIEQARELTIYDPDEKSREDPQMVTEFVEDILACLRDIEIKFPIKEKFLEDSKVTPKMRATLLNWLVDAHMNFKLSLEALHLSISIIDRYLQVNKAVDRSIFQLVGTAALLLASKYEEVFFPDIGDFVYICDDAFTKKQILQMEVDIVKKLGFRLGWPLSITFLRRYSKIAQVRSDQHTLAKYILELALLEYNLAHIKPSIQAAAACCLSIAIMNEIMDPSRVWTPTLVYYTTYKYIDLKPVLYEFAHMIVRAETSKFDTVKQKYSSPKFGKISLNFKLHGPLMRKLTSSPGTLSRK